MQYAKKTRLSLLALTLVAHAAAAAVMDIHGVNEDYDRMGAAVAAGDFNCDSYDDLVAGLPGQAIDGVSNAGALNVVYGGTGSGGRLGLTGNVQYGQNVFTSAEYDDNFAAVLAAGDFDGDGCDDVAVGLPYEDVGSVRNAGAVIVLYGHWNGLGEGGPEIWGQETTSVESNAEDSDYFGYSLAAGDFNGDGYDELAIGVPGEDGSGAVYVLSGQPFAGVTTAGDQFFTQDSSGIASSTESGDQFGRALVSGDFNNDGYEDLAIGVPNEDQGDVFDAGGVHVLFGSSGFLTGSGSQWWQQDSDGVLDSNGHNEKFGFSLAAGDFNNDGHDDLAIGVPNEDYDSGPYPPGSTHCGAVNVLYGSGAGPTAAGNHFWRAGVAPVVAGCNGSFGETLVAGDFDADGRDDLAIAAPNGFVNSEHTGSLQIFYGATAGLTGSRTRYIHQNVFGVDGTAEYLDNFGKALAAGDFNNDGRADLTVGIPSDIYNGIEGGAVQVFYGFGGTILDPIDDQLLVQ